MLVLCTRYNVKSPSEITTLYPVHRVYLKIILERPNFIINYLPFACFSSGNPDRGRKILGASRLQVYVMACQKYCMGSWVPYN